MRTSAFRLFIVAAVAIFATAVFAQPEKHDVVDIQRALSGSGYTVGAIDGLWGRRSINALAAFQKARGLPATGELDPATLDALFPPDNPDAMPPDATPSAAIEAPETAKEAEQTPAANHAATTAAPEPKAFSKSPPEDAEVYQPPLSATQPASQPGRQPQSEPPSSPQGAGASPSLATEAESRDEKEDEAPLGSGAGGLMLLGAAIGLLIVAAKRRSSRRRNHMAPNATSGEPAMARSDRSQPYDGISVAAAAAPITAQARAEPKDMYSVRSTEELKRRLAEHNRAVANAIRQRQASPAGPSNTDPPAPAKFPPDLVPTVRPTDRMAPAARSPHDASSLDAAKDEAKTRVNPASAVRSTDELKRRLAEHDAAVAKVVANRSTAASPGAPRPASSTDGWIPAGQPVTVGGQVIPGGMIYVGRNLPQQGDRHQAENCLIDPRLPIGGRGDHCGLTMGYWPAYGSISAEARKSYLQWLSGPRSDPGAYIGYVFLYFYGLERRLMLEPAAADAPVVLDEVRRLAQTYGGNHSFRRYSGELLSAYELKRATLPDAIVPDPDASGFDVPLLIKAALGQRVRDGRPIESDLLLAYVMAHPETSVRTPARRALSELRLMFAAGLAQRSPNGLVISAARAKPLKASYRAASGTFEVDLHPFGGNLPDISGYRRLLEIGRGIFDSCVEQLDDYSRALGKAPGLSPTLATIARLPAGLRRLRAEELSGRPLGEIEEIVRSGRPCAVEKLVSVVGLPDGSPLGRAKLKDLAAVLGAFGFGHSADPAFAARTAKAGEPTMVFRLADGEADAAAPGPNFGRAQASMMLGLMVALADGVLDERERNGLVERLRDEPGLSENERRRLKAELVASEEAPGRLADWMKKLSQLDATEQRRLADMLITAASADGAIDAREVAMLEKLFRRLGLDEASLYGRLHGSVAAEVKRRDDNTVLVIPPDPISAGRPIPPPPPSGRGPEPTLRVDLSRLEAIRNETRSASSVLAGIFSEEEEDIADVRAIADAAPAASDEEDDSPFHGLERRYGSLLLELAEREEWPAADFEHLARDAGLMPGAVRDALNTWSIERYDELLLEGEDLIFVNLHILAHSAPMQPAASAAETRAMS